MSPERSLNSEAVLSEDAEIYRILFVSPPSSLFDELTISVESQEIFLFGLGFAVELI